VFVKTIAPSTWSALVTRCYFHQVRPDVVSLRALPLPNTKCLHARLRPRLRILPLVLHPLSRAHRCDYAASLAFFPLLLSCQAFGPARHRVQPSSHRETRHGRSTSDCVVKQCAALPVPSTHDHILSLNPISSTISLPVVHFAGTDWPLAYHPSGSKSYLNLARSCLSSFPVHIRPFLDRTNIFPHSGYQWCRLPVEPHLTTRINSDACVTLLGIRPSKL
jgi:hypothetical protein